MNIVLTECLAMQVSQHAQVLGVQKIAAIVNDLSTNAFNDSLRSSAIDAELNAFGITEDSLQEAHGVRSAGMVLHV